MPRNFYEATMGVPDLGGSFKVLSGLRVSVFQRDTTTLVNIYQREVGITQGPSPEASATGGPNPFYTGGGGSVQFWADLGRYDILVEDAQAPARIGNRTIQWNSVPLDGIPGANLADLGVVTGKLGDLSVTPGKVVAAQPNPYGPPRVAALPASPVDGQEIYFVADATNGVIWHLRYNAGSASAYKWEFVGGSALLATTSTTSSGSIGSGSPVDLAPAFTVTLPLAGDYDIEHACQIRADVAQGLTIQIAINNALARSIAANIPAANSMVNPIQRWNIPGLAKNDVLKERVVGFTTANCDRYSQYWAIRPLRVG